MTQYYFKTPTLREGPAGQARLFWYYKLDRGVTIIKNGATYSQVRYPVDSELASYSEVYRGGYTYTVDATTKSALIAGGVGVTEANFTAI